MKSLSNLMLIFLLIASVISISQASYGAAAPAAPSSQGGSSGGSYYYSHTAPGGLSAGYTTSRPINHTQPYVGHATSRPIRHVYCYRQYFWDRYGFFRSTVVCK